MAGPTIRPKPTSRSDKKFLEVGVKVENTFELEREWRFLMAGLMAGPAISHRPSKPHS